MVFKKKEVELHIDNSEHYAQASSDRLLSLKDLEEIFDKGYMFIDSIKVDNKFWYTFFTTGAISEPKQNTFQVSVNIPASNQEEAENIVMHKLKA